MRKLSINTTLNYSPNFDKNKRKPKEIKFLILHYTGMKKEKDAIKKLTNEKSKVSCHYLIKNNGEILTLVPDLYTAWHAGISSWKNFKFLNKNSIGIEISNPGHENFYKKFSKKQINSILSLILFLIKKYKIKKNFILGHSDIAPERKKDPGEKFPWKNLAKEGLCTWHTLSQQDLKNTRKIPISNKYQNIFLKNLYKIGYNSIRGQSFKINQKKLTMAFQRRFRQELVDGKVDKECLLISKNLSKI